MENFSARNVCEMNKQELELVNEQIVLILSNLFTYLWVLSDQETIIVRGTVRLSRWMRGMRKLDEKF